MNLHDELARATAERDRLNVVIAYLEGRIGEKATPAAPGKVRKGKLTAAAAAERVLREHGEPMRTAELLVAVQKRGAKCKNGEGLYKTLLRSSRFKRAGRGLWTLEDAPLTQ